MQLRVSSRRSDLARIQAHSVAEALKRATPGLRIEFRFSESLGDKNLSEPLWKMPEKGVFTQDLSRELVDGETDMVIHSWKDLPVEENPRTEIVATLRRADVRDMLLFKRSSMGRLRDRNGIRLFSSSPRREYNLLPFLTAHLPFGPHDISFCPVRGNIPTRLKKLSADGDVDGLILAKAAVDRILSAHGEEFEEVRSIVRESLRQCDFMILPLSANPAAAAQGALAVEILKDRPELKELLRQIHDEASFEEAVEERRLLKSYGGGCHQKIGVTFLTRPGGRLRFVRGFTDGGLELRESCWEGSAPGPCSVVRSDSLFSRVPRAGVPDLTPFTALFVSSPWAWTEKLAFEGIRWTAGLSTWKKMAAKGLWIHGSAEGLGEKEDPRLGAIFPTAKWAVLSHGKAVASRGPVIATYDLVPKEEARPPEGECLHWTSGFLFEEALKRWPELSRRRHSCGPGKTTEALARNLEKFEIRWLTGDLK